MSRIRDPSAAGASPRYSASGSTNAELDLLITPQDNCGGSCSDYYIELSGRYAWFKVGGANASSGPSGAAVLSFTPAGLPAFSIFSTAASTASASDGVQVGLGNGAVGFSTASQPSVAAIRAKLDAARAAEEALLVKTFGADRAGEGQAVKASAMWTLVSTPAENGGGPLLPVSRVWNFAPGPATSDFTCAFTLLRCFGVDFRLFVITIPILQTSDAWRGRRNF